MPDEEWNKKTIEEKLFDIMQEAEYAESSACASEHRLDDVETLLKQIIEDIALLKEGQHK